MWTPELERLSRIVLSDDPVKELNRKLDEFLAEWEGVKDDVESGQRVRPVESAATGERDGEVGRKDRGVPEEPRGATAGDATGKAE